MTVRLDLEDPALRRATATVVEITPLGVVLDRSPFYPRSGGQPGDSGALSWPGGAMTVDEARKADSGQVLHPAAAPSSTTSSPAPPLGAVVEAEIDWPRRWAHMRMHTALHLLCSVLPGAAVTGGQIGADRSRLDFDLPAAPDKDALERLLAALVAADHPVAAEWVDEAVLDGNPALVRTLSVKPPRGTGRLRLVRIGSADAPVDLQPCGGTHVAGTAQVGQVQVLKIEKKGRQNRRIAIGLAP